MIDNKNPNFAYGFQPIYYFARIGGQMPFTITYPKNGGIVGAKLYKRDYIWFVIWVCIQVSFISLAIEFLKSIRDPNAYTYNSYFGNLVIWFLILIFGIGIMVLDLCNRFKIIRILNEFTIFDEEMTRFGIYFDYKLESQCFWLISVTLMLINVAITAALYCKMYDYYMENYTLLNVIEYIGSGLHHNHLLTAPALTYVSLLRNLQKRYAVVNQLLRNRIFNGNAVHLPSETGKRHTIRAIKSIGCYHSHLTKIMDLMNFCCSFQIMVLAGYTFTLSVLTYYTFYRYVVQQNEYFKDFAWMHIVVQMFNVITILIVLYSASQVVNEGKGTAHIAYDKINCCNDPDVSFSLTQLSLQVKNFHPIATCGLFPFDWTLLFMMIAAATTYLTILLNFGPQSDASRNQTCQHQ